MKRPAIIALALASLVLATSMGGCASGRTMFRSNNKSSEELQRLKSRIVDLQRQVRVNEVELARLRERMRLLEAGGITSRTGRTEEPIGSASRSTPSEAGREPIAPPAYVPPEPALSEPAPIDGASARTVTIEQSDLELPPSAAQQGHGSTPPSSTAGEPVAEATPVEPLSAQGQALYDRGYAQYNEGQYVDAEATFQQFLQAYPNTQLSDNAQYWIGEARLARGDNRGALAAFFETVEKFPQGNKVPDALLKAARCLQASGDRGGSRMTYDELIRRFPDTAAAAVAEEERLALP